MIPLTECLIVATILFVIGLFGIMIRRNLFFLLLSLMTMMNGSIIALVIAGSYWNQVDGEIMSILALCVALTQACIGLSLLANMLRRRKTINIDALSEMKG